MSLTTFVKEKDVAERISGTFLKPKLSQTSELRVPPRSKRYSQVATAFDYLLRFYVRRLNPFSIERSWIAEGALSSMSSPILIDPILDIPTGKVEYKDTAETRKVKRILETARKSYSEYTGTGEVTDDVLRSVLCLAQLDLLIRIRFVDPNLGTVHQEDVDDLRELIGVVQPEYFKAKSLCLLNPDFGPASSLVAGADADLLVDDTLLEIKVSKEFNLRKEWFGELVGYVVLNAISPIGRMPQSVHIGRIGIYFARQGRLETFSWAEIVDQAAFDSFVQWFRDRAGQRAAG